MWFVPHLAHARASLGPLHPLHPSRAFYPLPKIGITVVSEWRYLNASSVSKKKNRLFACPLLTVYFLVLVPWPFRQFLHRNPIPQAVKTRFEMTQNDVFGLHQSSSVGKKREFKPGSVYIPGRQNFNSGVHLGNSSE